jgi:hypothetical protein
MLFRETVAVYSEKYMEHMNTFCRKNPDCLNDVEDGMYTYHCALEV